MEVGGDDGEFVAADAGEGVDFAELFPGALGEELKSAVADMVAEVVVDGFELVEVEEEVGGVGVVATGVEERGVEAVFEEDAVGEAGEGIVGDEVGELARGG